jgi:hypothetical protein
MIQLPGLIAALDTVNVPRQRCKDLLEEMYLVQLRVCGPHCSFRCKMPDSCVGAREELVQIL